MAEQRERSRGGKGARFVADPSLAVSWQSEFIGYPNETRADGLAVLGLAGEPRSTQVVLDRSPFYAEGGGQIGDQGELVGPKGKLVVEDTQRVGDAIVHVGRLEGELEVGEPVEAAWTSGGAGRRPATTPPPTCCIARCATWWASRPSRRAAGWARKGCASTSRRRAATPRPQLREVERRVNEQIRRNAAVSQPGWASARRRELGADMFFGEKYVPENVRVVQVEGFSRELCGGTHVAATGQIGSFRITGESSIGAGLRRIEAVTGEAAEELVAERLEALREAATKLGVADLEVAGARRGAHRPRPRVGEGRQAATERDGGLLDVAAALAGAQQAGDVKVIVEHYPDADADALRRWADDLRGKTGRFVSVASGNGSGPTLVVAASRDLASEGFDAVKIVRQVGPLIGGGGGGRPELAQAGGSNAAGLDDALREAARLALEALAPLEAD